MVRKRYAGDIIGRSRADAPPDGTHRGRCERCHVTNDLGGDNLCEDCEKDDEETRQKIEKLVSDIEELDDAQVKLFVVALIEKIATFDHLITEYKKNLAQDDVLEGRIENIHEQPLLKTREILRRKKELNELREKAKKQLDL